MSDTQDDTYPAAWRPREVVEREDLSAIAAAFDVYAAALSDSEFKNLVNRTRKASQ